MAQSITKQHNRVHAHVKENGGLVEQWFFDFVMMNPPEFLGSQIKEDP